MYISIKRNLPNTFYRFRPCQDSKFIENLDMFDRFTHFSKNEIKYDCFKSEQERLMYQYTRGMYPSYLKLLLFI